MSSETESCVFRFVRTRKQRPNCVRRTAVKLREADCSHFPHNLGQYISAQLHTSEVLSPDKRTPCCNSTQHTLARDNDWNHHSWCTVVRFTAYYFTDWYEANWQRFCSWIDEDDLKNSASYRHENCWVDRHGLNSPRIRKEGGFYGVRRRMMSRREKSNRKMKRRIKFWEGRGK